MIDNSKIIAQIDTILAQWKTIDRGYDRTTLLIDDPTEQYTFIFTSLISTIERFAHLNSAYYRNAAKIRAQFPGKTPNSLNELNRNLAGILQSLREAYRDGYLQSVQELVHADLFDDFLEMAEHLLENNYKDAAAVMVGSVLESHIKKMCTKSGLPITTRIKNKTVIIKADVLNADLEKNGEYNKLQQKQITAWLGLRNEAAHGNYGAYKKEDVDLMLKGVRQFILQNPA